MQIKILVLLENYVVSSCTAEFELQCFSNHALRHDLTLYLSQADYLISKRHMRNFRLPPRCK
jgi:hypothetical protein